MDRVEGAGRLQPGVPHVLRVEGQLEAVVLRVEGHAPVHLGVGECVDAVTARDDIALANEETLDTVAS